MKNKKRMASLLLAGCMAFSAVPVAFAADAEQATVVSDEEQRPTSGTCGEHLTWSLSEDGTLTISGTGEMEDYSDDNESPWKSFYRQIKKVVIEQGVTSIGSCAFQSSRVLSTVEIPASVTKIASDALNDCWDLNTITVDAENEKYVSEDNVLFNKDKTTLVFYATGKKDSSYIIPSSVSRIGKNAFAYTQKLLEITIPETVKTIEDDAFFSCDNLETVTISNGVEEIGSAAFFGCSMLQSIEIPQSVTQIGAEAFGQCGHLKRAILPEGITAIKEAMFSNCGCLEEVYIPKSVQAIEDYGFSNCVALTKFELPMGLKTIGKEAFSSCGSINNVDIPATVTEIGADAFFYCEDLKKITFRGNEPQIGEECFGFYPVTIYYPAHNTTWKEAIKKDYDGKVAWKPWSASDVFTDVKDNDWFVSYVEYTYAHRMMNGMSSNTFAPYTTLSRAMVAQILYAQAGSPSVSGESVFSDVQPGAWYYNAVQWASQKDIVHGVGNGKFAPNNDVTREQMAVMLHAAQGKPSTYSSDLNAYADANQVSGWAKDAMLWCVNKSIIGGSKSGGKTYLKPQGKATRAEAATMLTKYDQNCRVY